MVVSHDPNNSDNTKLESITKNENAEEDRMYSLMFWLEQELSHN